jgi:mannonate dehydratase
MFIQTMRWFGPTDPVSLSDIRQAGCAGVVSALHQLPVGEVWPVEAIRERQRLIEQAPEGVTPLRWLVVESLPVHEDIKKGLPSRDLYIENYKASLRNLAACGIDVVCYNFMPVLDWSRTDVRYQLPNGARTLRFEWEKFVAFDLYILRRPGAERDYDERTLHRARQRFESMTGEERQTLTATVLLGLPGSEEAFELATFQSLLDGYKNIDAHALRAHLHYFVQQVAPLAEELGLRLCIHPDDPPRPLLGLPRVVSTEADLRGLLEACPVRANGITFCTGSLGVRPDNDLPGMVRRLGDRIHFVHLRSTKRDADEPLNFHEADHLTGDVDMYSVMKELTLEQQRRQQAGRADYALPMRPDHGHQLLDDLTKRTYPGYSAIGRLKGLAELRGLELAIRRSLVLVVLLVGTLAGTGTRADDGYRLWLKYDKIQDAALLRSYASAFTSIVSTQSTPMRQVAVEELQTGLRGLLGTKVTVQQKGTGKGDIVFKIDAQEKVGPEGYHLYRQGTQTIIAAQTEKGLLYGSFGLLRHLQTLRPLSELNITTSPKVQYRVLNHWDNPNGTVERGYAGSSIWKWYDLPQVVDPRYREYARANASLGINATVVNNVNASARFMTAEYLQKVKALAEVFRPYGIRVYLSVRFTAPRNVGGLPTADPLDPAVQQWWNEKVKEIYGIIPDFGGFIVKANSEGEPGPQDYNRTHADGANMLAKALAPYDGIVMWRAFVYKADPNGDRFKAGYEEFKPFDGTFDEKVLVQVKNGPIDFQPREPFSPLFGQMPQTPLMMEFQLTQEYLGFATHLVYQAPLFKETLDSDTYVKGPGSTVAKVVDGTVHGYQRTGMAGVANIGSDRNWTGHPVGQANWYAYGRLAWDHTLSSEQLADEWIKMTLTRQPQAVATITDILMKSREAAVNYMTPLGLHHIMGESIHYGPQPWLEKSQRPDWTSRYYHRADSLGIGFDRTATGSNALAQYAPEIQRQWGVLSNTPPEYLLWFHHVPWSHPMPNGRSLWDELCYRYYGGVQSVEQMIRQWERVQGTVDPELHADVAGRLQIQKREAEWWRDACVLYFQTYSRRPIPADLPKPTRTLDEIKELVRIYQLR